MKKILFLLLCTVSIYGQTSNGSEQEFDYGIKNNSLQTITTPPYLTTTGMDGTQGKIPSALIAKTSDIADSLATKENIANKSDSYTVSSSTTYASTKAIVDGLATKQNTLTNPVTGTFVVGRIPYTSSTTSLVDSSRLLWDNTNSYLEVNGNSPRFTLKNNLNNYSTYFTNNTGGALFLKNQQDKTLAIFNNPVTSTDQPKLAIGQVTSIPTESQLYVYGGENGANIDARGSATVDEANIDLEGNDWVTNPNSIGLSYFGSNATSFGTVMGYSKNKLGQIRFQDNTVSAITSNKVSGVSPIRFGINDVQIANVSDTGISYQSDFSSVNSSNPRWLVDKAYVVDGLATKQNTLTNPITGTGTTNTIPKFTASGTVGNSLIKDNGTSVSISNYTTTNKFNVDYASQNSSSTLSSGAISVSNNAAFNEILEMGMHQFGYGYLQARRGTSASFSKLVLNPSGGNILLGTTTDNGIDKLQVNGSTKTTALTLATAPTTSAGTYDILTRNTSTGVVEKVLSSSVVGGSGTTNYLPKFTGANSLGNSLIYDNGTNVGIGTTNPTQKFVVSNTGANGIEFAVDATPTYGSTIQSYDRVSAVYRPLNYDANVHIFSIGNVLIGTTTNNGVDKLQVNGSITATSFNGSATLTGTPTAPTAAAGTNTTQIATTAFVKTEKASVLSDDNTFTGSQVFNDTVNFNNIALLKSYTVSTLPTGMIRGAIAYVTDALAPTYMTTVVGGGSVVCPVFYNGTAWVSH